MKFLCICQYGHCRSVAMARALQSRGQIAVAIGHATSGDAIKLLAPWADRIIVMQTCFVGKVPEAQHYKVKVCDVGPDVWVNPYHQDLRRKCESFLSYLLVGV